MSFLTALLGPSERKSINMDALLDKIEFGGIGSKSGQAVNWKSALRVSVAFSCARVLAEGIAQIPFKLMQEVDGGGSRAAREHPLYQVLARRPNDWMTSFQWRETMMMHAIFAKGGYSVINRSGGKVVELLPVMPDCVRVEQKPDTSVIYWISLPDGTQRPFPRSSIFHLRGPSWNGIEGLDVIDLARESLGLALATEETHARFHQNGAKAAGIISMDGELKAEGRAALKKAFQDASTGSNSFKTLVLDQGAKFSQMSMTGVDSQHLETRRHQIEEVCRFMRVFPQMAGYSDKTSTFASAEQFFIAHVVHSLGPWVERTEQAADRDLLTNKEMDEGYFSKLTVQGLIRGDVKSRGEYYTKMFSIGAMSPNDIRALEDLNPYEGGEKYFVPMNMSDATDLQAQTDAQKAISELAEVKTMFTESITRQPKAPDVHVTFGATNLTMPDVKNSIHIPEQTAPIVNNTINVPKQDSAVVNNSINIPEQAAPVVHNSIKMPDQPVPQVHITQGEVKIDVKPTPIEVKVAAPAMPSSMDMRVISMPARETTSTVVRDGTGNIVKTTQTEVDK